MLFDDAQGVKIGLVLIRGKLVFPACEGFATDTAPDNLGHTSRRRSKKYDMILETRRRRLHQNDHDILHQGSL